MILGLKSSVVKENETETRNPLPSRPQALEGLTQPPYTTVPLS